MYTTSVTSKAQKQDGRPYPRKNERLVQQNQQFPNQITHTVDNLTHETGATQAQLKQTAQFGPQMNLTKSQVPHQTDKMQNINNDMSNYQSEVMSQKQFQQKVKSLDNRQHHYLTQVSSEGGQNNHQIDTNQNFYAQYTTNPGAVDGQAIVASKNGRN